MNLDNLLILDYFQDDQGMGHLTVNRLNGQQPLREPDMGAKFYPVSQEEMTEFLTPQNFQLVDVPGTNELVFARIQNYKHGDEKLVVSMRIYTGINKPTKRDFAENPMFAKTSGQSRKKGTDAIRVQYFWKKYPDFQPVLVGETAKCLRVTTWKKNLQAAIDKIAKQMIIPCPNCKAPMARREGKFGKFWGCSLFHATGCKGQKKL